MKKTLISIPSERIENHIYVIRDRRVMLDQDLAALYGIKTFNLNKAVNRNAKRFPADFMFRLSPEEWSVLKFQIGISNKGRGGRRYLPYAFTEHGAVMLANVIRSQRAIGVSVEVVRAFIHLRQVFSSHQELKSFILKYAHKTDQELRRVWKAIEELKPPPQEQRRIGFNLE